MSGFVIIPAVDLVTAPGMRPGGKSNGSFFYAPPLRRFPEHEHPDQLKEELARLISELNRSKCNAEKLEEELQETVKERNRLYARVVNSEVMRTSPRYYVDEQKMKCRSINKKQTVFVIMDRETGLMRSMDASWNQRSAQAEADRLNTPPQGDAQ